MPEESGRPSPFASGHLVVVDGDDQAIGFGSGRLQISDVTDVQEVEATVRKRDGATLAPIVLDELEESLPRYDLAHDHEASASTASRSSSALIVAVPRFITTSPPA